MAMTTKTVQQHNKPEHPSPPILENPSITVEKSFEISFNHPPDTLGHELSHLMLPTHASNKQTSLTPSTTYGSATSMRRPTTAHGRMEDNHGCTDLVCPPPTVWTSKDQADGKMDLHEALRSQLPPLRQSKRWAKTYLHEPERPKTSKSSTTSKPEMPPAEEYNILQQTPIPDVTHDAANVAIASDNESEHYGFCRPAHVPGWQAIKQHRLLKQRSLPTRSTKGSSTDGPKRMQSCRSMRGQLDSDPRDAVAPRFVQGRNKVSVENGDSCTGISGRWRRRRLHKRSKESEMTASSGPDVEFNQHESISPVSPLHDYEKVKRFSEECVNMLAGLDLGDEWRVSVIAPAWKIHPVSSPGPNTMKTTETSRRPQEINPDTLTTAGNIDGQSGVELFEHAPKTRCQSHTAGDDEDPDACLPKIEATLLLDGLTKSIYLSEQVVDVESADLLPPDMPVMKSKTPKSSVRRQIIRTGPGQLKPTRSVDTLTEIEAQVEDVPAASPHQLERKESTFTLNASPKKQHPSGQPPERPLPDLPANDTVEAQSLLHRQASSASSHKGRFVRNAVETSDPFRMSSVQTIVHIPPPTNNQPIASVIESSKQLNAAIAQNDVATTRSRPGSEASSGKHHVQRPNLSETPTNKTESNLHQRDSRMRLMKARRLDACCRIQYNDDSDAGEMRAKPLSQQDRSVSSPQLSNVIRTAELSGKETSNKQMTDSGMAASKTLPTLYLGGKFAPLPPVPVRNGFSHVVSNSAKPQASPRTHFKGTSATSRQFQIKQKPLKQVSSSTDRRHSSRTGSKFKQSLGKSQIMVVVDTNPHTASFRAGALSPVSQKVCSTSRPTTPAYQSIMSESPKSSPARTQRSHTPATDFDNLAKLIDIVKPPVSIQKKSGSRGGRIQPSARSLLADVGRNSPDCPSPTFATSRVYIKSAHRRVFDSSDSDSEEGSLNRTEHALPASVKRNMLRASIRRSHMRKDTPLTAALKEEVERADLELENLKKYEQRIENLQAQLDQTLKIWNRMSQNGKKQYLATTFGDLETSKSVKSQSVKSKTRSEASNMSSVAASSIYSGRSSVRRLDEGVSKTLQEAMDFADSLSGPSGASALVARSDTGTGTGTDTDTDVSFLFQDDILGKRASESSLTDTHDYDLPEPRAPTSCSDSSAPVFHVDITQNLKSHPGPETLGTNLDDLRARLHASRPTIPVRRGKLHTTYAPNSAVRLRSDKDRSVSCPDRYWIAPWERKEGMMNYSMEVSSASSLHDSGFDSNEDDEDHDRLSLRKETMRTDQMDMMLNL